MESTKAISTAGPTEVDIIQTRQLEKFLEDSGLYENPEQTVKRQEVIAILNQIVKSWVKSVTRAKGFSEQLVEEANATIFTFGSYRLNVHDPGADIDTLCIGPWHVTREEDFFGELGRMLGERLEVQELQFVSDAYVPVMKFKFNGISIDLLYARLALSVIDDDLDITQDSIFHNVDEQTIRSLNGSRVTDKLLSLVPNIQNFRTTLRCMKFWAKQRGIYSSAVGFLGGINLALLVGRICQLYPNALPSTLISRFFRVYSDWRWPNPIMLCPLEEGFMGLPVWDPRKYFKDRSHLMPIITPAYPCMNSSYNVSSSTLHILMEEFRRGKNMFEAIETNKASWMTLFEPFHFFGAYKDYLQIDISAKNDDDCRKWKGWVASRLRLLTMTIHKDTCGMLQCHPHPREYFDKSNSNYSYFIALHRKKDAPPHEGKAFDLRATMDGFNQLVASYNLWKPGMIICINWRKYKNLPNFVFPDGVRPLQDIRCSSRLAGGKKRKHNETEDWTKSCTRPALIQG